MHNGISLSHEKNDGLIYATTEVPNPWVTDWYWSVAC